MPNPASQTALFSGPGRFPALALYRSRGSRPKHVRARAAALLDEIQQLGLSTEHILVALSPGSLRGHPDSLPGHDIRPQDPGNGFEFELDAALDVAVMVQISAATAEDRVHALRLVKHVLEDGNHLQIIEELLGDVRTSYREPFGYPDGRKPSDAADIRGAALISSGDLSGGSWIFYQRFVHDLVEFFKQGENERHAIMGIDFEGDTVPTPPSDPATQGHVTLARRVNRDAAGRPQIIRRGFPFRAANGEEGLVFIGVTNEPLNFKVILQAMLGGASSATHDAMLAFVDAVSGGLFFAPPNAAWLAKGQSVPSVSVPLDVTSIERPVDEAVVLYPFTPKGLDYMERMRNELIFGNPVGWIDPVPNPDDEIGSSVAQFALTKSEEIHEAIAGGVPADPQVLRDLEGWLTDFANLPAHLKDEIPADVDTLVQELIIAANNGPLTEASVTAAAASNRLLNATAGANRAIASGVDTVPPPVRDLVNGTARVVAGTVNADPVIKNALDTLRNEAMAASVKVNQGQGFYITLNV